jgi:hypothetical protein
MRFGLIGALFFALVSAAGAQGIQPGPGLPVSGGGGGGYQGPGDVVSGAYAWYSCSRGYNAADTANACNVCLPSDTTCADITLTSGFAVLPGSLSTCNITTVICTVKTAYDKSGNSRDITQATESLRPTFRPAMASNGCPTTSLPCMQFVGSSSQRLINATLRTLAQPMTMSGVLLASSAGASGTEIFGFSNTPLIFRSNTNSIRILDTTTSPAAVTMSDNVWHAFQGIWNSTSSAIYVDATGTTGLNSAGGAVSKQIHMSSNSFSNYFTGSIAEFGIWASAFSGTNAGDMNSNQHGANGYNF